MIKFLLNFILSLLFWMCIACGFLPLILSTQMGKKVCLNIASAVTSYDIQAENINLSWFKEQSIAYIKIISPQKQTIFEAKSLTTNHSLWKWLFHQDIGIGSLIEPVFYINAPSFYSSSQPFLQKSTDTLFKSSYIKPRGLIKIVSGKIKSIEGDEEEIAIEDAALEVSITQQQMIGKGSGKFTKTEGGFLGAFSLSPVENEKKIEFKISQMPLQLLALVKPVALQPYLAGVADIIHYTSYSSLHFPLDITLNYDQQQLDLEMSASQTNQGLAAFLCRLSYDQNQLIANLTAHRFPSFVLDELLKKKATMSCEELLGPFFDMTCDLQLKDFSGPLIMDLSSSVASVGLNGYLQDNILSLKDPLYVEVKAFQPFAKHLSRCLQLTEIPGIDNQGPVHLEVDPIGFSLPVFPLDLQQIVIEKGVLEMGKLTCTDSDLLKKGLSFLQKKNPSHLPIPVWFAPLTLTVKEGRIATSRLDILLNEQFPLCISGEITLSSCDIHGFIGLPAPLLEKTFHFMHLPKEYVLSIPFSKTHKGFVIEIEKAVASILCLMHDTENTAILPYQEKHVQKKIDHILDRLLSISHLSSVFPAQKTPLPWEKQKIDEEEVGEKRKMQKSEQTYVNPNGSPLHQVLKYFH